MKKPEDQGLGPDQFLDVIEIASEIARQAKAKTGHAVSEEDFASTVMGVTIGRSATLFRQGDAQSAGELVGLVYDAMVMASADGLSITAFYKEMMRVAASLRDIKAKLAQETVH